MRVIHRTYKVELRDVANPTDKMAYERKYHEFEASIAKLAQDLDMASKDKC